MNLKTSALLALIGTALLTILLVIGLVADIIAWMSGAIAAFLVLKCMIYVFASLTLTVFLYTFYKAQR